MTYTPARTGNSRAMGAGVVVPTLWLVGFGLALTFVAGPLYEITDNASLDLLLREPYLIAVLGEGRPR